jgi:hypothetical protein
VSTLLEGAMHDHSFVSSLNAYPLNLGERREDCKRLYAEQCHVVLCCWVGYVRARERIRESRVCRGKYNEALL